jgi:hypothetical protein
MALQPTSESQHLAPDQGSYELNWVYNEVMELFRWSNTEHDQRYNRDWFFYYKHYKNHVDRRVSPDDYKSNIGVGIAFPIIEIVHARLMEPWMSGDQLVKAIAEEMPGEDKAPKVAAYINKILLDQVVRSYSKHSMMKKSALLFGRGVMKPYMRFEPPTKILQRIAQSIAGVRLGSKVGFQDVPSSRRLDFQYVDPFNWWRTPGSRMLHDDAEWCFERSYITTSEAHARQRSKEWDGKNEIQDSDAIGYDEWAIKRANLESGYSDQVRAQSARDRKPHRIYEFQGRLFVKKSTADKGKYKNLIVTIHDEKAIVKYRPLQTWDAKPGYLEWEPTVDPASERPIGMIEPIEDILLEINDYENIALDNARKILESPLLVDPNSTKQKKLYLGPGEINWVKNPNWSIKPLEMKDLPRSFYQQIGFLNDLIQRISGVSDYFGGMNTADTSRLSKTATGMTLMAQLSASRFGPMIASLDREYYREAARWIHQTAKLWLTDSENVRLPGNPSSPYTSIGPDELDVILRYNFNITSLDPSSEQRRQQYIEMTKMIAEVDQSGALAADGYQLDYYEMVKLMMDEYNRGGDVEKLVKELPQQPNLPMIPATNAPGAATSSGVPGSVIPFPTAQQPPPQARGAA